MTAVSNRERMKSPALAQTGIGSRVRSDNRLALIFTWLVLIGAAAVGIVALTNALQWRLQPFLGVMLSRTLVVDGTQPIGRAWAGLEAGLQRGDQVLALDGAALDAQPDRLAAALAARTFDDVVTVEFWRPAPTAAERERFACMPGADGGAVCTLSLRLTDFPDNDIVALFWIPFFAAAVTLGVGIVVMALRGRSLSGRIIAGIAALLSIFCVGLFDLNTTYRLTPVWMAAASLLGASAVALALVFPARLPRLFVQRWLVYVPWALALIPAAISLWLHFAPPTPVSSLNGVHISVLTAFLGAALACGLWVVQRRQAATQLICDQASLILIGFLFALIPGIVWLVNLILNALFGTMPIPFNSSAVAPFFALPALSMAYTVMQTRPLDADQWISKGITYTFLALGLVLGYFLLVLGVTVVTGQVVEADNPLLLALVVFAVAIGFVPVRTRLQRQIDRLYFRQRFNYQDQVEQFARSLSALRELPAISAEYRVTLEQTLAPTHVFIYLPSTQVGEYVAFGRHRPDTDIRFSADSALVDFLRRHDGLIYLDGQTPWDESLIAERGRLSVLKPLVIAGFRGSSRLTGFAMIGPPLSGAGRYSFEQQRFIENLTNQMTVAVERAQVVESLERRVRELGILSRVSQAVNFTGDYDQLLELIGTQTLNLIEATHVYIALRDAAANELYYAFVLEDGERLPDKENLRWALGGDLPSEVVRTGLALRVPHFGRAMSQRGLRVVREDANLQGWMGVPLIAGSRALGVLAVATLEPNRPFSADQVRMLGDIGALAATSLDKARLFAETNVRARQLSALNEVSRQLVATELDLDNLLQLITYSATDILSAEAGSLLLTVDDGSGDLEFKVDVGSPGSNLVGHRVPAGRGLVGAVAASGKVEIVNDVVNDPRWGGEVTSDGFVTRTILAAPLIAQNKTIGVIEIINKRAGAFTQDDANLLTTFAGQAAVAIDNARLFQMTDLQLTQRVGELEMMERIDAQMNRSHSLEAVAEIALQWAVSNTGATAGLIGVVVDEPPALRITARVGYGDDDAPPGASGMLWPIDRGIVSRVLRTRRAELVADVRIDPHYIPSLRGALRQATLPMLSGGEVIAVLVLESTDDNVLRLSDMPFLQRLAEHASIAIDNAQLYEELARADQSKSEFVSFVAHELKNPLTSIKGYADVLVTGSVGPLSDQQRGFISTIRTNAERMNTLVSDLNDVTKLQTNNLRIEPVAVDLMALVEETLRPLQKQFEDRSQQVVRDIPAGLGPIYADRNRMIQVLTNLLSNAHKYSPEGARITISAELAAPERDAQGKPTGRMLHVRVKDEGIGMSEDDLARLFTPYFRSDNPAAREQPGTGLGLTITRGIIERHHGRVWVESALGSGTTFHFTIPMVDQDRG